jgi:hypothetical protein
MVGVREAESTLSLRPHLGSLVEDGDVAAENGGSGISHQDWAQTAKETILS